MRSQALAPASTRSRSNDQGRVCYRFEDGDAYEVCDDHEGRSREERVSAPNTRRLRRRPVHPGEMLRERRALSPEMALRLARSFGNSAACWLNLQRAVDLHEAHVAIDDDSRHTEPLHVA